MLLPIIALAVATLFFGLAGYQDWRKREVQNWVWVIYGPLALAITLVCYSGWLLIFAVSFMVVNAVVSIGLFYAGVWGGGDSKAFMCLGVGLPFDYLLVVAGTAGCSLPFLFKNWRQKPKKEYPIVTVLSFAILLVTVFKLILTLSA